TRVHRPCAHSSRTSRAHSPRTHASGAKNRPSTVIQGLASSERRALHLAHHRPDRRRALLVVIVRRALAHVELLAHLELHRVHVFGWTPVVARDVAALETAV